MLLRHPEPSLLRGGAAIFLSSIRTCGVSPGSHSVGVVGCDRQSQMTNTPTYNADDRRSRGAISRRHRPTSSAVRLLWCSRIFAGCLDLTPIMIRPCFLLIPLAFTGYLGRVKQRTMAAAAQATACAHQGRLYGLLAPRHLVHGGDRGSGQSDPSFLTDT